MGYIALLAAILCNALGNILLKIGADKGINLSLQEGLIKLLTTHWALILGVFFFAINVVFYTVALRLLPLSVAYPVMVGAVFIIVGITAAVHLGESLSLADVLGYLLIVGGIVLISVFGRTV